MNAAAKVAQAVEPFLARHPDFALVGRSVVLRPVGHLMRRFFIDRTAYKDYIQPIWSVATTFGPPPKYLAAVGDRMVGGTGNVCDPENRSRLLEEMERIASDILRTADIDELPDLAWKADPISGPVAMTLAMPMLAKGDFAKAAPYFAEMLATMDDAVEKQASAVKKHRSPDSRPARIDAYVLGRLQQGQQGYRTICDLLSAGDAQAIAVQLHAWEAAAVRLHKVEHLWTPSRFPFESA